MEGDEGASDVLFWNRLLTSNLACFDVDDAAVEEDAAVEDDDAVVEDEDAAADGGVPVENDVVRECILPFVAAAGTLPKDLIPSGLIVGTDAGEDEIGAEASSIDPKVTDEPSDV